MSATYDEVVNLKQGTTVTTVHESVGLPGYAGYSWTDVEASAAGGTVSIIF